MKDTLKLALSLGIICLIGSAALTWVYSTTKAPIEQAEQKALQANLKMVLPPETKDIEKIDLINDVLIFKGLNSQGEITGYAAQAIGKGGFKGDVKVLVGLDPAAAIRLVLVTDHNETPGIGSKATDRKVQRSLWELLKGVKPSNALPPNPFLDSFNGRTSNQGDKAVRPISGATYSSSAVIQAVNKVFEAMAKINVHPNQEAK